MKLLTSSSVSAYRACPRLYQIRYVRGYRAIGSASHALHFGRLWHLLQEAWWGADGDRCQAAEKALAEIEGIDPFDRVKLQELMRGYHLRWMRRDVEPIHAASIEEEFRAPLINPDTGAPSRTFERAGKKDLIAERAGELWLVEHKTSSEDIQPGSAYWQRLRMNAQVSNYYVGARANGHDIVGCIYDVVAKPKIRPLKATPADKRKYTKAGALYAGQRADDETPSEYAARLREHIAENPDAYYQRGEIYRLANEEREAARDLWHTARAIRDAERLDSWPRNDAACFRWNRQCDYWDVCTGQAQLEDPRRFEQVRPHEELSKDETQQQEVTRVSSSGNSPAHGPSIDF